MFFFATKNQFYGQSMEIKVVPVEKHTQNIYMITKMSQKYEINFFFKIFLKLLLGHPKENIFFSIFFSLKNLSLYINFAIKLRNQFSLLVHIRILNLVLYTVQIYVTMGAKLGGGQLRCCPLFI